MNDADQKPKIKLINKTTGEESFGSITQALANGNGTVTVSLSCEPNTEYGYTISMPGPDEEIPYKLVPTDEKGA